ncbi:MAG: restriction endonuclease [Flavobacteriales bacterium]|nr:restriction endonuclease [Flavobacteriales bacterium]
MDISAEEFEILLCQFCQQDLPPTFKVEHDIKDVGGESENKRQIDTKISGKLGVSDILICGEAKNWSNKVGSETIDGLVGKYLSGEIRANKVICFSIQGFTEPAITRAKTLGIELLEPADLGNPIQKIPHIVGVGYLGQMIVKVSHKSPQQNLMAINVEDYVILKGEEQISFQQNMKRHVAANLKSTPGITLDTDLSKTQVTDSNVLYELKQKEGYKYNGDFKVDIELTWDYFYEFLPTGVLRHLNTDEIRYVNLQGSLGDVLTKVLMSPTKGNYESKEELIENVVKNNSTHRYHLCLTDPDRNKTNPTEPIFELIK